MKLLLTIQRTTKYHTFGFQPKLLPYNTSLAWTQHSCKENPYLVFVCSAAFVFLVAWKFLPKMKTCLITEKSTANARFHLTYVIWYKKLLIIIARFFENRAYIFCLWMNAPPDRIGSARLALNIYSRTELLICVRGKSDAK